MRRPGIWVLALLAACGGDEGPQGALTARVTHYDYTFDIDSRAAHAQVTAIADAAGNCFSLPFRAEKLDATTARLDSADAVATVDNNTITVCGRGVEAGATFTIDVDCSIPLKTLSASQVGFSLARDSDRNPFVYLVSWVDGCDQFGPCDNRPDQFATYTFHVTHPPEILVRCPGVITDGPTETTCDFTFGGGPTYSTFGVAAYPAAAWPTSDRGAWGSVHVVVQDRTSTGIAAAIDNAYHAGFIAFMEATFGAFPYGGELRVLTAPTYWSGFEHPGNIVLDDNLARSGSLYLHPVAHVLDHEMAHQWAGDQTTLADTYDFVWKEATAEYLAYVYEDTADKPAATATASAWKQFAAGARYFPVPGDKPALFDYYGDAYGPGPMILFRQLEAMTSRDKVIAALKSVLGAPRALSVDELVAALARETGLDLTEYAAAWIHGTGAPDWPRVTATFDAAASKLTVTQVNPSKRLCKFHVALQGANANESALVEVDTFHNGTAQTITVPKPPFVVASTVVDPLGECLVFPTQLQASPPLQPWRSAPRR